MDFTMDNSVLDELPADSNLNNTRRQVTDACYSFVIPKQVGNPKLLHVSDEMLKVLDLSESAANSLEFLNVMSGNTVYPKTKPYSWCYGGHQFGHWAGQLGDGRAINLFEVINSQNNRYALQLKGAGETPYSRSADGLAVLRSSIREYLCSEAMYHLGVPTTRALSLVLSGDDVLRDMMYNGNSKYEPGAIVCRVSPSFIRFGNFELFTSRGDTDNLKRLVDYTITHFYPSIVAEGKQRYLDFFNQVCKKSLDMVIHWQRVGFVHGVMNTDNMSILGLTIDYGPYGWLEGYEYGWTPNTTDREHKRYRFGNQPNIVLWNLVQLANALYPLIADTEPLEQVLEQFKVDYESQFLNMKSKKIGLFNFVKSDNDLIYRLEGLLHKHEVDMTIFYRLLGSISKEDSVEVCFNKIELSFYNLENLSKDVKVDYLEWFSSYLQRLRDEALDDDSRQIKMNALNPKYVLRNYMAQLAIEDAEKGEYTLLNELYQMLKAPYKEQPQYERWFQKRPEWARHKVGCSMLSCSS